MNSKLKTILIVTITSLSLFLFYWYDIKPSSTIKKCQFWSIEKTSEINGDREDANYFYKKCLRENGIDK